MIIKVILCIIIPLLLFSVILDKKSRRISLSLSIGTIICLIAYLINNLIAEIEGVTYFYLTTTISPIIEELLKFIPIIIASFTISKKRRYIMPQAFALGIGFAIIENVYRLLTYGDSTTIIWTIFRGLSTGLMHSMSASIIALGISKSKEYPKLKIVGIIASLFLAMIYHGLFNCLVVNSGILEIIGICLPILTYIPIFIIFKKDLYKDSTEEIKE